MLGQKWFVGDFLFLKENYAENIKKKIIGAVCELSDK